jgi:uncharacterized protein (DUF934 family)
MRVVKEQQIIEDGWQLVADEALLPEGDIIVPLNRFQTDREALLSRPGSKLGVCINGAHKLADLEGDLQHIGIIALDFQKLGDGRCFSHARLLRERYGYRGELRAVGYVIRDLLFFMHRCGIDSFQLREDKDPEDAIKALSEFTVKYQTAADGTPPIYRQRFSDI